MLIGTSVFEVGGTDNNTQENVHGCCDKVIVRVRCVHLINLKQCQVSADPQTESRVSQTCVINLSVGCCRLQLP